MVFHQEGLSNFHNLFEWCYIQIFYLVYLCIAPLPQSNSIYSPHMHISLPFPFPPRSSLMIMRSGEKNEKSCRASFLFRCWCWWCCFCIHPFIHNTLYLFCVWEKTTTDSFSNEKRRPLLVRLPVFLFHSRHIYLCEHTDRYT